MNDSYIGNPEYFFCPDCKLQSLMKRKGGRVFQCQNWEYCGMEMEFMIDLREPMDSSYNKKILKNMEKMKSKLTKKRDEIINNL